MDTNDWIELIQAVAWPVVALIGILILGPGGVLMNFAKSIAGSISDFRRSLPELVNTASTLRADVNTLVERSKDLSTGFSVQVKELEDRIDAVSYKLTESFASVSAVLEDLDRSKIVEGQAEINRAVEADGGTEEQRSVDHPAELSPEEMWEKIRGAWLEFVGLFKVRLGTSIPYDGRQIGALAWRLADGRRNNPIASSDAELIAKLHSQYKRFVRLQTSKEEWLSPAIYEDFVRGIGLAARGLQSSE